MIGLPYGEKNCDDMLSRFHLIPERYGQTDRFAISISRVSVLTGDKNRNPRADPDYHQKSTTSRGSSLARACQVWLTSVSAFVSYPVYRMI